MCYIYAGVFNKTALKKLAHAEKTNVHGFGLYCHDCKIIEKTVATTQYKKYYNKHKGHNVIAHFRLASIGKITLENVQPIYRKNNKFALFHNGTNKFVQVPKKSLKSDTLYLFEYIVENHAGLNMLEFLKEMQEYDNFGNYILIDGNKRKMYVGFKSGQLNKTYFTTSGSESFNGVINLNNGKSFVEQLHRLKRSKRPTLKRLATKRLTTYKDWNYYDDLEETVQQTVDLLKPIEGEHTIRMKNTIYKMTTLHHKNEFECEYDIELTDQNSTEIKTIKVILPFIPKQGTKIKTWRKIKNALSEWLTHQPEVEQ